MSLRVLVATGFGLNCEEETAHAFNSVGAKACIVHLNDIFHEQVSILDFDVFVLPGGFSYGDDLGSGRMLAHALRYKKLSSGKKFFELLINEFLPAKKSILGICNGFQALVQSGLLPNVTGKFIQEATLAKNTSLKFEDRFVHLIANEKQKFFSPMYVPVRHGEGRIIFASKEIEEKVQEHHCDVLFYADKNHVVAKNYPENPNGSYNSIAGLKDLSGQVLGLMPHPEACLSIFNRPDWPSLVQKFNKKADDTACGSDFFKNYVVRKGIFK